MRKVVCRLSNFGFATERPAPAVQVFCFIPRINHSEWVDFLIDTGASETCLNGIYALDLQQDMRKETLEDSLGVGGGCQYYHESSILIFQDEHDEPFAKQVVPMGIQQITPEYLRIPDFLDCPPLIGRDILEKCIFHYEPSNNIAELTFF